MADAVDTLILFKGKKRQVYRFTNVSDGTGESAVVKIDKSTLINTQGLEPAKIIIEEIQWSINGFTSVRIFWDHTTDDEAAVLGTGQGFRVTMPDVQGLVDPGSAGGTGDVLFTTAGAVSGATYDILLSIRLTDAA